MLNIILYDPPKARQRLLPLTFTRPVAMLRHGIMTIVEKWQHALEANYSFLTQDYLSEKFPCHREGEEDVYIPGNLEPTPELLARIQPGLRIEEGEGETPNVLNHIWDIFGNNGMAIEDDFAVLTMDCQSLPIPPHCTVIGDPGKVFLAKGAKASNCSFNTTNGPIYIGPDAEVMEGSCLRGPVALCEGAVLKMGAKVYPATTLGPHCKCGGELSNVVMQGYSNKAHDGFLGNAVIGEWCNLGAGCVASNLKNTYGKIRLWDYETQGFERTNLQFCGLIMGDYSCAGINTMFNTATMAGVGINFYGAGFPRTFIPSFTQGTPQGMTKIILSRLIETVEVMMSRRDKTLTQADKKILEHLFSLS